MKEVANTYSLKSYIEKNRENLDESLVSLRIMREVDGFLDYKKLSNRDLALQIGCSESYISQLMSGVKKVNTSFINKFEKEFLVKFDFKIYLQNEGQNLQRLHQKTDFQINVSFDICNFTDQPFHFSMKQNSRSMYDVTDVEYETI